MDVEYQRARAQKDHRCGPPRPGAVSVGRRFRGYGGLLVGQGQVPTCFEQFLTGSWVQGIVGRFLSGPWVYGIEVHRGRKVFAGHPPNPGEGRAWGPV